MPWHCSLFDTPFSDSVTLGHLSELECITKLSYMWTVTKLQQRKSLKRAWGDPSQLLFLSRICWSLSLYLSTPFALHPLLLPLCALLLFPQHFSWLYLHFSSLCGFLPSADSPLIHLNYSQSHMSIFFYTHPAFSSTFQLPWTLHNPTVFLHTNPLTSWFIKVLVPCLPAASVFMKLMNLFTKQVRFKHEETTYFRDKGIVFQGLFTIFQILIEKHKKLEKLESILFLIIILTSSALLA